MKLLLDEHYSPAIARQLRERGHDVVSTQERRELLGRPDREIFDLMAQERRAVLTEDAAGFVPLAQRAADEGTAHYGLLLTSSRSMPRSSRTIGRLVRVLDAILQRHRADDAFQDTVHWLKP